MSQVELTVVKPWHGSNCLQTIGLQVHTPTVFNKVSIFYVNITRNFSFNHAWYKWEYKDSHDFTVLLLPYSPAVPHHPVLPHDFVNACCRLVQQTLWPEKMPLTCYDVIEFTEYGHCVRAKKNGLDYMKIDGSLGGALLCLHDNKLHNLAEICDLSASPGDKNGLRFSGEGMWWVKKK